MCKYKFKPHLKFFYVKIAIFLKTEVYRFLSDFKKSLQILKICH